MELHVDMIEVDVRLSRDKVPVLWHNDSLARIGESQRRVSELGLSELQQLDVGAWKDRRFRGERMLTLAEALDMTKDRVPLNLDIKTPEAMAPVIALVRERRMLEQVVVSGCSWQQVRELRTLDPHLHVLINVDGRLQTLLRLFSAQFAVLLSWFQAHTAQAVGLNISHRLAANKFIQHAAARDLPVWTWTVDDLERARELAALGVASITSNWPNRILAVRTSPAFA